MQMRPQKLSRELMLGQCALEFKRYGYAGTSMDTLAKACGLSKAAFYYHYSGKEALLTEILEQTQCYLQKHLFATAEQTDLSVSERMEQMHRRAVQFFSQGVKGCLIGMLSLEAPNISYAVTDKILQIFNAWEHALYMLFCEVFQDPLAAELAKVSIADYEGAILMYRLKQDDFYLNAVRERLLRQLNSTV